MMSTATDAVLHNAVNCLNAVFPADFLAFIIAATRVGNADLVNFQATARQLCGHLRLEPEPVLLQIQSLNVLPFKELIARLHVGDVEIGEHVAESREYAIAHSVPKEQYPPLFPAGKSRAIHHIRAVIDAWPQ